MLTQSFCIASPEEAFKDNFRNWLDRIGMSYPTKLTDETVKQFNEFIKKMWSKYGNDILNVLAEKFGENIRSNDDVIFTKAVVNHYIDWCYENPFFQIDVEAFWKESILKAMDANELEIAEAVLKFTF